MEQRKNQGIKRKERITKEICDVCNVPIEGHPRCDACKILTGPGHIEKTLIEFMKRRICSGCHSTS